jgi:glutamate--cysteine ligase
LQAMQQDHGGSFVAFARARSEAVRAEMLALELPAHIAFEFAQESQASWDDQRVIEAADTLPFEQYRQEYLSPDHLVPRKKKAA